MWKGISVAFLTAISWLALSNMAFSNAELRAKIDQGDYTSVKEAGPILGNAEGFTLAAESLNAQILLGEVDDLNDHAKMARDLAEQALALDPDNFEARMQYALADGFVTRTTGNFKAWRKKLPFKTLERVEALHADYPNDARTQALLAAWHLGVIRETGENNGAKWFNASLDEGRRLYEAAIAAEPDNILIAANFAAAMIVIDEELYGPEFRPLLEKAASLPAKTHIDDVVQQRVKRMLAIGDDWDELEYLCEDFLDGKPF